MRKALIIGLVLLLGGMLSTLSCSKPSLPQVTVKITNLRASSGGSGTIISHSSSESVVLTNAHVCHVVENGGIVSSDENWGSAVAYKASLVHDLCLIKVSADLHHSAAVSSWVPLLYEEITVSGHPHLLPVIMTRGHVSAKNNISVMTGLRDCRQEDLDNPSTAPFCMLFGKLPLVKSYEAQAISATIQPGSSGSGVYNSANEIVGLVFAGAGDFGYGYIVPSEYVYNFVNYESKLLSYTLVDSSLKFADESSSKRSVVKKMIEYCQKNANNMVDFTTATICNTLSHNLE